MRSGDTKRRFLVSVAAARIKILLFAGLLPLLAGCYVGEGFASVDPDYFGPLPPKAPNQRLFICDRTVSWELPREREGGDFLAEAEIATVTIYAAHTPLASDDELAFIMDVDPYLLQWQFLMLEPGEWLFRLTATDNNGLESKQSNERNNEECM